MTECTYGLYKITTSTDPSMSTQFICLKDLKKEQFDDISTNYEKLCLIYEAFGLSAELTRDFNRFKKCNDSLSTGNLFQKEKEIRSTLDSFLSTAFRVKAHFSEHVKLICGEDVGKKFDESCQEFYKSNISAPLINTCNNIVKHQQELPLGISDGLDDEGTPKTTLILNADIILQNSPDRPLNAQVVKLFENNSKIGIYPYALEFYNFLSELIRSYITIELLSEQRACVCFNLLDLFVSKINEEIPVLALTKIQQDADFIDTEHLSIELILLCNIMSVFLHTRQDFLGSYWGKGISEKYIELIPGFKNLIEPDTSDEQKIIMHSNIKYVCYKKRLNLDGDFIYQFVPNEEVCQSNFDRLDSLWRYYCALVDGLRLLSRTDCYENTKLATI